MIRKLDELGRVAIPQEYCEKLGIKYNDKIDIIFENNVLILKKAADTCVYCGKEDIIQGLSLYGKPKTVLLRFLYPALQARH